MNIAATGKCLQLCTMTTAQTFEVMKNADQEAKDVINGFIRNAQSMLEIENEDNPYYNIPSLVFVITMLYYYNPEYFTVHGDYILLNGDGNVASASFDIPRNTVYGNVFITKFCKGKYIWTFNIVKSNKNVIIAIGIDSSNKKFANSTFNSFDNASAYYAYQCWAEGTDDPARRVHNGRVDDMQCNVAYGAVFSDKACQIKMELDMDHKRLKYYVDGKDQGIAFCNICFKNDEKYSMCISMDETMCIKLSDYQHVI